MNAFIRLGAYGAVFGGALKIIAAFIPYSPQSVILELLYAMIDAGLLLGLIAVFLVGASVVGGLGLASFVIALLALASIIGPEAEMFGVDFYYWGGSVFSLGLVVLSIQLLRGQKFALAAGCWITSAATGLLLSWIGSTFAFLAAGVVLGVGFLVAGCELLKRSKVANDVTAEMTLHST